MTKPQKMPFDSASFSVLYVGHFDGHKHYAVFVTQEDGKLKQIRDTVRKDVRQANTLAQRLAHMDNVPWYGYAG